MKQETIKTILENKKMIVNGVDIQLTEEQLKQFESLVERHKMSKPKIGEFYYYIDWCVEEGYYAIGTEFNNNDTFDLRIFELGQAFFDRELAEQVAMDMNLQAKLRQFTYENGCKDEWLLNDAVTKWITRFNVATNRWSVACTSDYIRTDEIHFKDRETCERAIEEIVKPFCKANPTYRFNKGE